MCKNWPHYSVRESVPPETVTHGVQDTSTSNRQGGALKHHGSEDTTERSGISGQQSDHGRQEGRDIQGHTGSQSVHAGPAHL